jgi:hypothetical protein
MDGGGVGSRSAEPGRGCRPRVAARGACRPMATTLESTGHAGHIRSPRSRTTVGPARPVGACGGPVGGVAAASGVKRRRFLPPGRRPAAVVRRAYVRPPSRGLPVLITCTGGALFAAMSGPRPPPPSGRLRQSQLEGLSMGSAEGRAATRPVIDNRTRMPCTSPMPNVAPVTHCALSARVCSEPPQSFPGSGLPRTSEPGLLPSRPSSLRAAIRRHRPRAHVGACDHAMG